MPEWLSSLLIFVAFWIVLKWVLSKFGIQT
jgi:hypothetical protein